MKLFPEPIALLGLRRSPVGKIAGSLAGVEPFKLLSHALAGSIEASGVSASAFDEVIVGNLRNSVGNIARVGALDAGVPQSVPAITVDRQCASSMEALALAAAKIASGQAKQVLVGGVESASQAPWLFAKTARPYAYFEPSPLKVRMSTPEAGDPPMGETAELLADEFSIAREEMDAFSLESHRRAIAAMESGAFDAELLPVTIPGRKGDTIVSQDECPRADTTLEALAKLPPAFRRQNGRVTAGNSSPINDGSSACVAMSLAAANAAGLPVEAHLLGAVAVGLDPNRMGMGPALAIPALLKAANLSVDDIDLFEINEAFAAQILAVNRELCLPLDRVNVNGGAIALGHPLGATGMRLIVTLVHALRARNKKRGVASLCVGGGQGMAVLIEIP